MLRPIHFHHNFLNNALFFNVATRLLQVPWRTVMSGIFLQFLLGLFVLRWDKGFLATEFLGNQTIVFLEYTKAGSKFVFGDPDWEMHELVMMVGANLYLAINQVVGLKPILKHL